MKRPREVVVVDAENPMEEIRGEFFWREDHERLLTAAREASYRDGYERGYMAGVSRRRAGALRVRVVRRRWTIVRALMVLVVSAYLVTLVGSFLR
jgi:hypothetical protein